MLARTIEAVNKALGRNVDQPVVATEEAVNCHHNYVARESHFGKDLLVTRKGAVRAGTGELGIIPGSMGARSFIVRGKGNPDSYCSCSHGAGRVLSRTEAKKRYTTADQIAATAGIECRKDEGVIDEIPMAYKDIDAVSIATPNHWHALASIWAMQAGKDVYVEKPVSHCVWEGRQMVNASRKYGKIVQTGTQSRSSRKGIGAAVKYVQEGNLGKILLSRGLCYKRRGSIGKTEGEQKIPDTVEYDLWCGPGPKGPLMRKQLKYDWHWTWAYGNGDLGNQGIHQMDIARWFLGEMEISPSVWSVGGRLGYEDDGETANTQIIYHGYEKAPMIFEVRGLPENKDSKNMDKFKGAGVGVVVECERRNLLGSSVKRGDKLFRIAQVRDLYVVLQVPEHAIRDLQRDAQAELLLLRQPVQPIRLKVSSFVPMAQVKGEEGNQFVLKAQILDPVAPWWRPGMTGLAKIDAGTRNISWVLFHRTIDKLRLWFWW
jgi:hypothetical protein